MQLLIELIVNLIHIIIFIFIIITPFCNINILLFLYVVVVPNILLHWLFSTDICSVVILEEQILKCFPKYASSLCIFRKIILPIYHINVINNKCIVVVIYSFLFLSWIAVIKKLYFKYKSGKIKTLMNLIDF